MIVPTVQEVIRLAKDYNLIPISREIWADTDTPIRIFHHFYRENRAFLLESVEGGDQWARYSFIGTDPFLYVKGKRNQLTVEHNGEVRSFTSGPIEALRELLQSYRSPAVNDLPRFTGGAVGFFGYDILQFYENLPEHDVDDLAMNDIQFMFCDQVIVFDHMKQRIKIIANVHIKEGAEEADIVASYEDTCRRIDQTVSRLQKPIFIPNMAQRGIPDDVELGEIRSNMTREQFEENVRQAKRYIDAGELLQVVLSQRFEIDTNVHPLYVYRVLRSLNPSPYMYYLKMDDEVIVGTSPELLVRVEGDTVMTRPIAGTRPRGSTPEEDKTLEEELLADEKERAEHMMLVDLGQNDLNRVCEQGSVRCDSWMEVERYSHVMHIVSHVSGKLRQDCDFYDAFLSCLPAGTVSGAPKLRAMEVIAELEKEARGLYAGAIGYLGFSGNMDTCIAIRTVIFKNGKAYVQAGAGIVSESIPAKEYEETENKAAALLKAIRMAEMMKPSNRTDETEINQDYYFLREAE